MAASKALYETLAREILRSKRAADEDGQITLAVFAQNLSTVLAAHNPRFDQARFLSACRGEDYKTPSGRMARYAPKG